MKSYNVRADVTENSARTKQLCRSSNSHADRESDECADIDDDLSDGKLSNDEDDPTPQKLGQSSGRARRCDSPPTPTLPSTVNSLDFMPSRLTLLAPCQRPPDRKSVV